jgi:hypothetical protein
MLFFQIKRLHFHTIITGAFHHFVSIVPLGNLHQRDKMLVASDEIRG